jgi:hypothetical protein
MKRPSAQLERRELNIKALNSQQLVLSPSVFLSVLILTDRWEWRNSACWARRQSGVVSVDVRFSHRWFSKLHNTFSVPPLFVVGPPSSPRRSRAHMSTVFLTYILIRRGFSQSSRNADGENLAHCPCLCVCCVYTQYENDNDSEECLKKVKHQKMLSFQQGQTSPIFPVLQLQG